MNIHDTPNDIISYKTPLLSRNKRNRIISQGEKRYLEFNDVINDGAKQKMYFLSGFTRKRFPQLPDLINNCELKFDM